MDPIYYIYNSTSGTLVQSPRGPVSDTYQIQSIKTISKRECLRNYKTYLDMYCPIFPCEDIDLSSHVCTKYYTGYKGICFGDSGSPLICNGAQYGVANTGISCGLNRVNFEVWILVHFYRDWIESTVPQSNFTQLFKNRGISSIFNAKISRKEIFVAVTVLISLLI